MISTDPDTLSITLALVFGVAVLSLSVTFQVKVDPPLCKPPRKLQDVPRHYAFLVFDIMVR